MTLIKKTFQKLLVCVCLTLCCQAIFAQESVTIKNFNQINTQLFCITTPTDTIHFVKYDTINEKKPLFFFMQGSLPTPLIIDYGEMLYVHPFSVLSKTIFENFNVIAISQPNTPPIVEYEQLDNRACYVKSKEPGDYDKTYMRRNVTETYVERANTVINYLIQEDWIETDSVYVYGHSQGGYVAAHLAAKNESVTAIAFSSTNPFGRYSGLIQEIRSQAINGKITEDDAQKHIEQYWGNWYYLLQTTEVPDNWNSDLPATWIDFSKSVVDVLANLKQPVFVTYGTKGYHSIMCELLPIYFGFQQKMNYKMFPVIGRGHNFELIDSDGKPNYEDMKWEDVLSEFVKFVKNK